MSSVRVDQHSHPHMQQGQQQQHQQQHPPPSHPPPHLQSHSGLPHSHSHPHPLDMPTSSSSSSGPLQPTPVDISHHIPSSSSGQKVAGRKRKKAEDPDDPLNPNIPPARRLRRLHEACARCRSKKIKCDSKLPSCTACTAANVECNQEDRHRQTLKPRGYTDMVEAQLAKCILVLEKLVPDFKLNDLDDIMARHGIHVPQSPPIASDAADGASTINPALAAVLQNALGSAAANPPTTSIKIEQAPPNLAPPPKSAGPKASGSGSKGASLAGIVAAPLVARGSEGASDGSSTVYDDPRRPNAAHPTASSVPDASVKGQDPQANDLSSTGGLIKAFGVSRSIVKDLPKPENEGEDVLGGVRLEDDPLVPQYPKAVSQWTTRSLRQSNIVIPQLPMPNPPPYHPTTANVSPSSLSPLRPPPRSPSSSTSANHPSPAAGVLGFHPSMARNKFVFRLPKSKDLTEYVVHKYFDRLNMHRPVYVMEEFMDGLTALYDSLEDGNRVPSRPRNVHHSHSGHVRPSAQHTPSSASVPLAPQDDPGFLCSVYLILALGRLCIDNEAMHEGKEGVPEIMKDFPTHEEFFELALAVKHDLRVTISSLQALILLQWYLYTERHGRTLWRLVGNLVRLSIELGLHHDPSEQENTFTPAECELRNRLWWIVMIHDRGTSVLLGRPLAIADADFNTPFPKRHCPAMAGVPPSEHFEHSPHLTSIQGDIINALYRPGNHKQSADQVLRHASRITKGFGAFSRGILGPTYRAFFEGTETWTNEQKIALVGQMSEDQGLTLLKYGIARILLLRALFTNSALSADARRRALKDAVITSHNILTIQIQVTSFPSIAFFVSPIPIHIAAMVILYGVISECDALPYAQAKEDVCSALHTVLLFRWRWNRKDAHGSHPLIVKLAQKVFGNDVLNVSGPLGPPLLIPEWDWTTGQADAPLNLPPSPPMPNVQNGYGGPMQGEGQQMYHGMDGMPSNGGPPPPPHWEGAHPGAGHSRHMSTSGGAALPPTPVSATMPPNGQQHPSPPHPGQTMMGAGSSPQDGMHYSPPNGQPLGRIDDTDKDTLVRLMYPPPLDQHAGVYYGDDPQESLGLTLQQQQQQPPMHMMPSEHDVVMHAQGAAHGQPSTHIPPPHIDGTAMHPQMQEMHAPHPHHPQQHHGLPSHQQHHMYASVAADYNQSATHFVQEEYDGKQMMGAHLNPDGMLQGYSGPAW